MAGGEKPGISKRIEKAKDDRGTPNSKSQIPTSSYHTPVLLKETIESLDIKSDGLYVDCTFGGGDISKRYS
jgi:hypothetical protein